MPPHVDASGCSTRLPDGGSGPRARRGCRRGARRRRWRRGSGRASCSMPPARSAAAAPRTTSRRGRASALATSSAVGSVKISLPSTISSTASGRAAARSSASVREVGLPLGADADLDHRDAAVEQRRAAARGARRPGPPRGTRSTRRPQPGRGPGRAATTPTGRPPGRRGPTARSRRRCAPRARPPASPRRRRVNSRMRSVSALDGVELLADEQRRQRIGRRPSASTAGERAAVAVARLAVADEPGVGLDPHEAVRQRVALERERRRERGDRGDDHRTASRTADRR